MKYSWCFRNSIPNHLKMHDFPWKIMEFKTYQPQLLESREVVKHQQVLNPKVGMPWPPKSLGCHTPQPNCHEIEPTLQPFACRKTKKTHPHGSFVKPKKGTTGPKTKRGFVGFLGVFLRFLGFLKACLGMYGISLGFSLGFLGFLKVFYFLGIHGMYLEFMGWN